MAMRVSSAIFEKSRSDNYNPAMVFDEVAPLLLMLKFSSKEIMKVHEGSKVFILSQEKIYSKVQLTDNVISWIENKSIKEFKK